MSDEDKQEVKALYKRLAERWDWPLPSAWLEDRDVIANDLPNALICLRALVADQCPIHAPHVHYAFEPK